MKLKDILIKILFGYSPLKEGHEYCGACGGEGRHYVACGTCVDSGPCDKCDGTGQLKIKKGR